MSVISEIVVKNIRNIFFFLDRLVQKLFLDKNCQRFISVSFYLKSISLLLISVTLHYLSSIPSCISAVGEETSEPETSCCVRWKLYCCFSPSHHLTPENCVSSSSSSSAFCLSFVFFSFSFIGLLRPLLQICEVLLRARLMRPEVNSDQFEISNCFEKLLRLHDDFNAATCKW